GTATRCAPYRCNTDGTCAKTCTASTDCVPGFACDTSTGICAAPAIEDTGAGGCSTAPGRSAGFFAAAAVIGALLAIRRRALTLVVPLVIGCRTNDAPPSAHVAETLKVGVATTTTDAPGSTLHASGYGPRGIACHATGCLLAEPRGPWIVGTRIGLD